MKKLRFATAALAFALAFSATSLPAMADSEILVGSGESFVDIEVEYVAPTDNRDEIEKGTGNTWVYSVTLEWETAGKITYNAGKTIYSWNNEDLQYDSEVSDQGWKISEAKVTITAKNRSNRPIEMSCSDPEPISGIDLTGKYDQKTVTVGSAAVNGFDGVGEEQSASVVYTITGVSGEITEKTENIATITVVVTGK